MVTQEYLEGFIAGQWETTDRLLNLINTIEETDLRRSDFYRILMEYRPRPPERLSDESLL